MTQALALGIDWRPDGARLITTAGAHVLDVRILIGPQQASDIAAAVGVLRARAPAPIRHLAAVIRTDAPHDASAWLEQADTPPLGGLAPQVVQPGAALAAGMLAPDEDGLVLLVATPVCWAGAWQGRRLVLASDASHLPIEPWGSYCSCGERGCLRTLAAEGELIRKLRYHRDPGLSLSGGLKLEIDAAHRDRGAEVVLRQLAGACRTALRALAAVAGPLPAMVAVPRTLDTERLAAAMLAQLPPHQAQVLPTFRVFGDDTLALGAARAAAGRPASQT